MPNRLNICFSSRLSSFSKSQNRSRKCIRFCVLFPLLPLAWHSSEQHLVSPFLQERFKAQRAPTEQVLSSQFRLLCHLLEASDGRHHKHTTRLSRPVATMLLRKARYAFSLELSLLSPGQPLKTGTYRSPSYFVNKADEQS
jgi:hypothetical protein